MRCSKVYKNRSSRRRKKHGTGQGSKAAVQKPERRLPGWLGQAGTDSDKAHKAACLPGGCMGLNCSKQQDLKQCGGIGPAQKIQRQREPQCGIAEQRDDLADRYLIKGGIHGDVFPRYDSFVHTYRLEVCM